MTSCLGASFAPAAFRDADVQRGRPFGISPILLENQSANLSHLACSQSSCPDRPGVHVYRVIVCEWTTSPTPSATGHLPCDNEDCGSLISSNTPRALQSCLCHLSRLRKHQSGQDWIRPSPNWWTASSARPRRRPTPVGVQHDLDG